MADQGRKNAEKGAAVCAQRLCVGYGAKVVVDDLSFTVSPGQIVTLVGPNGSGKSTILKSIAAQLKLLDGVVTICGEHPEALTEKELAAKRAVVLTERISPELMTCREVVETGRYPYTGRMGMLTDADHAAAERAMEEMHIAHTAQLLFTQVSDGQKQQVLLARAICQQPRLLILDEPTSYLDLSHKLELLSLLKKQVREKQLAVLLSLHEVDLALRISDMVLCIRDGKAWKSGPPEKVLDAQTVRTLYDISYGSYDGAYGSAEMAPVQGAPRVFVIGGGGGGLPVYRRLWREGVPFASGILAENDIEYPAASALASELISVPAFEGISEDAYRRARDVMLRCEQVVCAAVFGTFNERCRQLLIAARSRGLPVREEEGN